MKNISILYSCLAATILVTASFLSVVGYQPVQATKNEGSSPLFAVRTQQATQQQTEKGLSAFLGKGTPIHIFPSQLSYKEDMILTAIRVFSSNPSLFNRLLDNMERYPVLSEILTKYGVTTTDVKIYMRMIQQDPSLLTEKIFDRSLQESQGDPPQPLGLSTSNPLGCVIVAIFALLPVTIVLTLLLLLFTLRILTCLNINDCGNNIANGIWEQLIQGLTQQ